MRDPVRRALIPDAKWGGAREGCVSLPLDVTVSLGYSGLFLSPVPSDFHKADSTQVIIPPAGCLVDPFPIL